MFGTGLRETGRRPLFGPWIMMHSHSRTHHGLAFCSVVGFQTFGAFARAVIAL
jgi:hypothetical protein